MKTLQLLVTFLFFSTICTSQSLFQKLNGVKTNFTFTSNTKNFLVKSQGIISKGVYNYNTNTEWIGEGGAGYGYGYGYQAKQLELISMDDIRFVERAVNTLQPNYTEVNLYNSNDENFLTIYSNITAIAEFTDLIGRTIITIDINNIPMTLLDDAKRIDIKKVRYRYFTNEELETKRLELKEFRKENRKKKKRKKVKK